MDVLTFIPVAILVLYWVIDLIAKDSMTKTNVTIKSEDDLIREFPDAPPRADKTTREIWEKQDEAEIERYFGKSVTAAGD
jgi:hypothetical protein